MECNYCRQRFIKKGFQQNKKQWFYCKTCKKYGQQFYTNNACKRETNNSITLVKEGCGIRRIGRILKISFFIVITRIKVIAKNISKPGASFNRTYEVDELRTFIGNKENRYWVACELEKESGKVIEFKVGKRTKKNYSLLSKRFCWHQHKKFIQMD